MVTVKTLWGPWRQKNYPDWKKLLKSIVVHIVLRNVPSKSKYSEMYILIVKYVYILRRI